MDRKYKDSGIEWIGKIPETWEVSQLSNLFKEHSKRNIGIQENNLLSLSYGSIIRKDINDNGGLLPESFEGYNIIEKDDIVFRLTDLQNDKRSLRTGLVKERGIITSAYVTVRKRDYKNSSSYFHYLFHSCDECKIFYGLGAGVRQGMNFQELKKLGIVVPPLSEQKRIADYLDEKCGEIDSLIALQEHMIEKLKAYKQSIITEAVTKGLDTNAKLVPSGIDWIGDIPEGWQTKPFKELFRTGKGLSFTKADLVKDGIPVISYGQVHSKQNKGTRIDKVLVRFVPEEITKSGESSKVNVGDFIFADTSEDLSGCGNCVYVDREIGLYAGYHSVIAFSKRKKSNTYLAYLFLTDCWRSQIRCRVSGIKVFSISQAIIKQTSIILPSENEQEAIATYLDEKCADIDRLIALKQQKIESLKDYKKSVIYEAVTGKTTIE